MAFVLVLVCVMPLAAFATDGEAVEEVSKFFATYWALVPPIVAIVLALITKEVYSSLFIGIVLGGLLSADFNPVKALDNVVNEGLAGSAGVSAGNYELLFLKHTDIKSSCKTVALCLIADVRKKHYGCAEHRAGVCIHASALCYHSGRCDGP